MLWCNGEDSSCRNCVCVYGVFHSCDPRACHCHAGEFTATGGFAPGKLLYWVVFFSRETPTLCVFNLELLHLEDKYRVVILVIFFFFFFHVTCTCTSSFSTDFNENETKAWLLISSNTLYLIQVKFYLPIMKI